MSEQSLKKKTAGALLWSLLDRAGQQVLFFAVGIFVANLLRVEDYSLIGMLAIFTAISTVLLDSGFSAALIQKKTPTETDYVSVFWFNMAIGWVLYLLLTCCSPLIAHFFNQPKLVELSAVLFLALPINAFGSIQATLLTRDVAFRQLTKINMSSMFVASMVALIMAFTGCGVWTLAVQPVALATVRSSLLWRQSRWRPKGKYSPKAIKELFAFASNLLGANLLSTTFMNIYSLVIGKIYPVNQLGYYTQGSKMSDMGVSFIYVSIQSVTFPILSSIQDDCERLLRASRKTIRFTAFIALPAIVGLIVIARPMIELLLKEKWWSAIPFFQLLCVGGCFTIFTAINNNFIKVQGRSDAILKIEYLRVIITIISLLLTWKQPVLVMVCGLVVTRVIVFFAHLYCTDRYTGYRAYKQLYDIMPYLLLALLMAAAIYPLKFVIENNLLLLLAQIVSGAFIYLTGAYLAGSNMLKESLELLRKRKVN
ncbi:lipopolysaccharide biosynthesis protein [Bacteroides sp. 214]|uniref:lipopolysaccharide biosynthesis protein n=1 Tax=Bacteroides sp. 214 TaxID=2302935 RepID=UPI0013D5774F|nr:lipopolysaccharide biosynthesis protein [Bacteroides sp. 214]NDW12167.1 lipopolysaccharide biosynthesis protein [Bacteroides sp. 214]